jgi:hypothetical protein
MHGKHTIGEQASGLSVFPARNKTVKHHLHLPSPDGGDRPDAHAFPRSGKRGYEQMELPD